ncbi:hypothetical protein SASPL_104409 [Salvia splendens]|uniref:(E)-4-hydroxy-3-methylbut-2-enyl-diphosphate synthase n=1 Tax=Salvia splendens TaxID=180675 RepID=A0A8X9A8E1_SALSN|nr:hypothetical protein SASPL_104409 [Salvia splendens]
MVVEMASGVVPASYHQSIGFAKSWDFVRASNLQSLKFRRSKGVPVIRNSTNTIELEPASDGSPLLGIRPSFVFLKACLNVVPRQKYCESIHKTIRRKTCTVMVGNVALGSEHPIRIQTMTTTDTKDVAATVEQVMSIADRGADIVRITVQGRKETDPCFEIKNALVKKNYNIPLVADIHFAPSVAMRVAECFEKIRVNPGNFGAFSTLFLYFLSLGEHSLKSWNAQKMIIRKNFSILTRYVFTPLVEKCKKYGRAMRIGTNHGSLSDRIMSYYGDSPRGMAYRLLVTEMNILGWEYPLHLGVTEAGEGEDGGMKSAIGIGTLLMDGLDDTIRVSLTEPPEEEIDPCNRLANLGMEAAELQKGVEPFEEKNRRYFDFQRRSGQLPVQKEGEEVDYRGVLHRDGSVFMSISLDQLQAPEALYKSLATKLIVGMPFKDLATVDSILLRKLPPLDDKDARLALKRLIDVSMGVITPLSEQLAKPLPNALVMVNLDEFSSGAHKPLPQGTRLVVSVRGDEPIDELEILKSIDAVMILHYLPYTEEKTSRVHAARRLFEYLSENSLEFPVIHHIRFPKKSTGSFVYIARDDLVIGAGTKAGSLLVDGLGDGVLLEGADQDFDFLRNTSFNLLQGCRLRNTKTLFLKRTIMPRLLLNGIILPCCDMRVTIMGCIVNGPGEMADADFGYVGGAPGKIDLYVGKTVVQRGIAMEGATDALIQLIKDHDRWVDPPAQD